MDFALKGAAVCVSGGSKGLGFAVAKAFAAEGARVVVSARGAEALAAAVDAIRDAGAAEAFGIQADIGKPADVEAMFGQIGSRWGTLNTLVNMAGPTDQSMSASFAEVPEEEWAYHINIAIMSAVRCTRAAVPLMKKAGWGRVVNVSSVAARLGEEREAPYMTAKAGLNALSRNMAVALAPDGILVNTVTPGVFCTEAMRNYMEVSGATERFDPTRPEDVWAWMRETGRHRYAGMIGHIAMPEAIAPIVLLLGSPANSYIVGANIPIDGGTDYGIV